MIFKSPLFRIITRSLNKEFQYVIVELKGQRSTSRVVDRTLAVRKYINIIPAS